MALNIQKALKDSEFISKLGPEYICTGFMIYVDETKSQNKILAEAGDFMATQIKGLTELERRDIVDLAKKIKQEEKQKAQKKPKFDPRRMEKSISGDYS